MEIFGNFRLETFSGKVLNEDGVWYDKDIFINKLKEMQSLAKTKKSNEPIKCQFDNFKTSKLYYIGNTMWDDSVLHYVTKHNIKPSSEFIDFVFRYNTSKKPRKRILGKLNGEFIIKYDKTYMKLDRNQILIMDALLEHGSYKIYKYKNKKEYKYSEHYGLLDFDTHGLNHFIISGKTNVIDEADNDIFLPKNMREAQDYEYMFHTHPPTPTPGARAQIGVLYEYPSVSDILHYIDHYNSGKTQGSIVIAPEGMYIIHKLNFDDKKIVIDEDAMVNNFDHAVRKAQYDAILKYGIDISLKDFYEKVAQESIFIDRINKSIKEFDLFIQYYPRIKEDNKWIIDTIYLPIYVVE